MSIRTIISKAHKAFLINDTAQKPKVNQECKSLFYNLSESEKKDISLMIKLASVMVWCEDWESAWNVQRTFFENSDNYKPYSNEIEDYLYLCFVIDSTDELELFSYYGWLERYFENAYRVLKCINGEYPKHFYEDDPERLAGIEKFKSFQKRYA